jgi:hypothetical protein
MTLSILINDALDIIDRRNCVGFQPAEGLDRNFDCGSVEHDALVRESLAKMAQRFGIIKL